MHVPEPLPDAESAVNACGEAAVFPGILPAQPIRALAAGDVLLLSFGGAVPSAAFRVAPQAMRALGQKGRILVIETRGTDIMRDTVVSLSRRNA